MSKGKKEQLNSDDLQQVKSLIGDAKGDEFSLDDILAEFGSGKHAQRGAIPVSPRGTGGGARKGSFSAPSWVKTEKVISFPGGVQAPPRPQEDALEEDDEQDLPFQAPNPDALPPDPEQEPDNLIQFPQEESVLSAFIKDVKGKADDYADRMFEEDERIDPQQVRRLEQLIPGTDWEEEPPQDARRFRPARAPEPPPPDRSPQELAKVYGRGLKGLRVRGLLVFALFILSLAQLLIPAVGLNWLAPMDTVQMQSCLSAGLMGLGLLLCVDVALVGLGRALRGKVGMDTLCALSCLFTLADGVSLAMSANPPARTPYTAVALAGLWLLLHGTYHKRCALRLSCRTASASSAPYRITLDEGKWNGRDTYTKWSATAEGFGSQIQMDDGAQRIFRRFCPLLLLGNVLLALLTTTAAGRPEQLLWGLSALFTATASFGGALAYGRSFHKIARRLVQSGAALAGWPGVANAKRGERVVITDGDLFPPGYVELNGYKVLGSIPMERVVAYTATLIRDSGSGLGKLFHDQLRALGGLMRKAEGLCCYEGGGISATIRGDQVLVGSAAFMNLMEIPLPPGLNVKNAVFCAIDGELAGIFALSYALPDTVFPSLEELMGEKVGPVLATRDFNLIPAMLHQRFKLAADKMDFPPVERRRELSDPDQPHSEVLTALLCREGLFPFAEAVAGAKRLRWATRLGAILCCVGATLGLMLGTYLVSVVAYGSLSPLNLLVFMLTWLAPVWFLSGWVHRY